MPVLAWYGYCREPQVMALSLRGSRSSQPIVLIGFLYFSKGMFVPMHVFIAMFAEMYKKIVVKQGSGCEGIRPPAMAGVD